MGEQMSSHGGPSCVFHLGCDWSRKERVPWEPAEGKVFQAEGTVSECKGPSGGQRSHAASGHSRPGRWKRRVWI